MLARKATGGLLGSLIRVVFLLTPCVLLCTTTETE